MSGENDPLDLIDDEQRGGERRSKRSKRGKRAQYTERNHNSSDLLKKNKSKEYRNSPLITDRPRNIYNSLI